MYPLFWLRLNYPMTFKSLTSLSLWDLAVSSLNRNQKAQRPLSDKCTAMRSYIAVLFLPSSGYIY